MSKSRIVCALLAAMATGCGGLPLPTPGAVACSHNVYLEAGSPLTCEQALTVYDDVQRATGVDMDNGMRVLEFMNAGNLAQFGRDSAIGLTADNDVAVVWNQMTTLYHEVLHLDDHTHCDWSVKYLDFFNEHRVLGAFVDDCRKVRCQSARMFLDSSGQFTGDQYACTPL